MASWAHIRSLGRRMAPLQSKPRPLVFCGPSGVGKSTLIKKLMGEFPTVFGFSISHTTRKPRPGEHDGKDYHYVQREDMEEAIRRGEFIESAIYSGNLYGTSKKAVEDVQQIGKICILDIDAQGVRSMKQTDLSPWYIFVRPPSWEELERRLRSRNTETEESLARRLTIAQKELEFGEEPGQFDLTIVNDDINEAYRQLREFIMPAIAEIQSSFTTE